MSYTRQGTYPFPRDIGDERTRQYLEQLYRSLIERDSIGEYMGDRSPNKDLKELIIRPEWYKAKGDGVTDDTTAIQAAGNAVSSTGGILFLSPGKTYKIDTALSFSSINNFIISGYGVTIDASDMAVDSVIMTIAGATTATATTLSAAGAVNDTALTVVSSSGFSSGDMVSIESTESLSEVDGTYTKGELAFVESVAAGTINISQGLKDAYSITGETVTITRISQIVRPVIEGLTIIGGGASKKQHAINIDYAELPLAKDVRIIDVEDTGITFAYCESGIVDNCYFRNMPGTANGVGYGASMSNLTQNSIVRGCRGEETSAGASVDGLKACWNNKFTGNTFANSPTTRGGIQCHNCGIGTQFIGNIVSGAFVGVNVMAPRCIVSGNVFNNISYTGVVVVYDGMRHVQISDNSIIALHGIDVLRNDGTSPSSVMVSNNDIVGTDLAGGDGDYGVYVRCAGATIKNNKIHNSLIGVGVGTDDVQVIGNEIADVTSGGYGILIYPDATYGSGTANRTTVRHNRFYNNNSPTTMSYGVWITDGVAGTIIENNHIQDYLSAPYNDVDGTLSRWNWHEDPVLGMVQEPTEWDTNWGVSVMGAVSQEISETHIPYRPEPTERLTDGGLETWSSATNLTHWGEATAGSSTVNRDGADTHGGTYSCRVDIDSSNNVGYIFQTSVPLGASASSEVSLWYKASSGKTAYIQIRDDSSNVWLKSDGSWSGAFSVILLPEETDWTEYTLSFVSHPSYSDYTLLLRNYDATSGSIYWDDVSLTTSTTLADSPITTDGTTVSIASLQSFANDAAAGVGGLTSGDLYVETGTDPLRLAVKT